MCRATPISQPREACSGMSPNFLHAISKVDDMLAQQQKMYDRIYAPAESLVRIEERLNSIDKKLDRDEKELFQKRKSD